MIKVKDLRVADVRYFDASHNGIEYTQPISRVVLLNRGDTYINLLNPGEIAPIYRRVPNTTNAYSTEDYFGTKIEHVCGEEATGEAWLLADVDFSKIFGKDEVYLRDVEDYVIDNRDFYHNRVNVIQQRLVKEDLPFWLRRSLAKIVEKDGVKQGEMDAFFANRGVQKVYSK